MYNQSLLPDSFSAASRLQNCRKALRYGSGCRIVSHWVLSVLEKTMERRKYNGLSYDFGFETGL